MLDFMHMYFFVGWPTRTEVAQSVGTDYGLDDWGSIASTGRDKDFNYTMVLQALSQVKDDW